MNSRRQALKLCLDASVIVVIQIVDTFLAAYDFKDKLVIPFCTSGGSGMGNTAQRISELTGAKVAPGKRLGGAVSEEDLKLWTDGLGL